MGRRRHHATSSVVGRASEPPDRRAVHDHLFAISYLLLILKDYNMIEAEPLQ
jgi:hypothetical protein